MGFYFGKVLLLLAVAVAVQASVVPKQEYTPNSLWYLTHVNGKSFFCSNFGVGERYKNRQEAAAFCENFNMRLANIRTAEEMTALEKVIDSGGIFLGAYYTAAKAKYVWDTDEVVDGGFRYDLRTPLETCLYLQVVRRGTLVDVPCTTRVYGVLCETK